ncbi:purine nucleoside permease [Mycena rosella]|uniref:Purine nucleoside permease n=1 Tax=Mycena rosella TaxID=1033263 RepID=A0AAD7CWV0_MYCRO|nr:purine nucleoside permease [Mycena rosella]
MFTDEANVWYNIPEFNVLAQNITVAGLSPLFPQVHCTKDGSICQITTGEGEINAASSIAALVHSPCFDLTSTYFMIAGIAGVNPKVATIGSVTFARYAVQVGLQFEIDAREIPADFPTGYFGQFATAPDQFPGTLYGTEVFEVNDALRQVAFGFAKTAEAHLNDSLDSQQARATYANFGEPATCPPAVVLCDTATSDTFWSGTLLGEAFENTTKIFTNGSAVYCTTQQEDSATLNALMRGAISKLVDFSRIIVMRSASDFDRQSNVTTAVGNLLGATPGFEPSVLNLHIAGVKVVQGIADGWKETFERGVKATHYVGDIFGSLGGQPDFGPGSIFGGKPAKV